MNGFKIKKCSMCSKIKSSDEFLYRSDTKDNLGSWCAHCRHLSNKENSRRGLLRKYGIMEADYEIMFKHQGGICAICDRPEIRKQNDNIDELSVDHCHETGITRELLCSSCNLLLGKAKDDSKILRKAADYLEKHHKRIQDILSRGTQCFS